MSQRFKAYADICFTTADIKPWWASPLMTCINESPQQCFTPMKIYSNELPQGLPHHVGLTTTQTAKNQVYVSVIITIHDPQHNNAQLGHWSRKLYLRHYSAHWKNTWIYQGGCRPSRPPPSGLDSMASSIWHVMSHMSFLLYHFSCHCYQIPIYIYIYIYQICILTCVVSQDTLPLLHIPCVIVQFTCQRCHVLFRMSHVVCIAYHVWVSCTMLYFTCIMSQITHHMSYVSSQILHVWCHMYQFSCCLSCIILSCVGPCLGTCWTLVE